MAANQPDSGGVRSADADLSNCDREPIHLLGRIQSFGFLLGLSPEWEVTHASTNVAEHLDLEAHDCLGKSLTELFPPDVVHTIRNRIQFLRGQAGVERARFLRLNSSAQSYDAMVHISGDTFVIEFEPSRDKADADDDVAQVKAFMSRLAQSASTDRFYTGAVRALQLMTGFDRVMLYRFLHDNSGEVIAESAVGDLESYVGLRYPASDIPTQARELYLKNTIRIISDVADEGVEILSLKDFRHEPLDLSQSGLRSVSPIHREYLANMGVAASMSVSVIVGGKLWGLLACHHRMPLVLDQARRAAADLFGQMFSLVLAGKLTAEETALDEQITAATNAFNENVVLTSRPVDALVPILKSFSELLRADGFGLCVDGHAHLEGLSPPDDGFKQLISRLNNQKQTVVAQQEMRNFLDVAETWLPDMAGFLAISISRSPRDYIVFFRREIVATVNWAGDPGKPATGGPDGGRLRPRKSFQLWQETVRGQGTVWTPTDLRAAAQLRLTLLEVVLRFTDIAARERLAAHEKQELLIAELNHRVRNILGLVKGIVSQSRASHLSTAEYVDMLDSRIQALARAHDQITRESWSAASFHELVRIEAESYLLDKRDRVVLVGDDFLLQPAAFSTMALVMHELMTNAAKYGALTGVTGSVQISLSRNDKNAVAIEWLELDGPAVSTPKRRGFGSTIIERSIPFELGGMARVDYAPEGVRAVFEIPATYVSENGTQKSPDPQVDRAQRPAKISPPQSVLVVEDNLLIAMEAEDLFKALGTQRVDIAADLATARRRMSEAKPEFALLDVSLGAETTYELALELQAANIKFAFASGYGDNSAFPEPLRKAPRLSKPFEREDLVRLLHLCGFRAPSSDT